MGGIRAVYSRYGKNAWPTVVESATEKGDGMRLEYLREFVVAATCLNFTAAAKQLYLTQPKVSAHIAAMEKELGFPLFDRLGGLSLTHEGRRFFEGASQIIEDYDRLVRECADSKREPRYRFVLGEFSLFEMFPPTSLVRYSRAVELLGECHPSLDVDVIPIENNRRIADLFAEGQCDVSFRTCCLENVRNEVVEVEDGMSVLPLEMDEMVAWIRCDHPLSRFDRVPVNELEGYPILLASCQSMRTWTTTRQDFMRIHGLEAVYKMKNASTPSAFVVPTKGDEVFLVAEAFSHSPCMRLHEDMVVRPLCDTMAQSCFCLCFPTDTDNPAVLELVEVMQDIAQKP